MLLFEFELCKVRDFNSTTDRVWLENCCAQWQNYDFAICFRIYEIEMVFRLTVLYFVLFACLNESFMLNKTKIN